MPDPIELLDIPRGATKNIRFQVRVDSDAPAGTITNTAHISTSAVDEISRSASNSVTACLDPPLTVGEVVVALCALPPEMVNVGWTLIGWVCDEPRIPADIAKELGGAVRIYGYNPANPLNPWRIFDTGVPPFFNNLAELTKWNGYWINYQP